MKIAVKEINKELRIEETNEVYRTNCVKQYIGKEHIAEFVPLNKERTFFIGVNEDGLHLDLETNFLLGTESPYFPIQKMVGTVVFLRIKEIDYSGEIYDYEVDDLTDEDFEIIDTILSEEYQEYLKSNFNDYGKGGVVIEFLK